MLPDGKEKKTKQPLPEDGTMKAKKPLSGGNHTKVRRLALYGMLIAAAFILSWLEHLVPLPVPTGVKLGLANTVVLAALYLLGGREALFISIIRVILVGFTFGSPYSMLYGLAGGLVSFAVMALLKRTGKFGFAGVSAAGGVGHNIGQLAVAVPVLLANMKTDRAGFLRDFLFWYFPLLLVSGIVSGIVIGMLAALVWERVWKQFKKMF